MLKGFNLSEVSDCFSLEVDNLLYFSGFSGVISSSVITRFYLEFIVVVINPIKKSLFDTNSREYAGNNNDLILHSGGYNISINYSSQVLIVDQMFFRNINTPKFPSGLIEHVHDALIRRLFEAVKCSDRPVYEILALANIIGVDNYQTNINNQLIKIKKLIEDNSTSEGFNLGQLCGLMYMSKRKVQYILSDANTSFLELLNGYRIEDLRALLLKEPITATDILVDKAGFNNQITANRLFKRKLGVSISEFKRSVRSAMVARL